jgi:hypothetical protein
VPVIQQSRENSAAGSTVRVVRRHHALVRWAHWLNVPILLGLVLSGISIYWASPIYQHKPDPQTGIYEYFADAGIWMCAHVPGLHAYSSPPDWVYNHFSLGTFMLAPALRLHWFFAYLFIANGLLYLVGLALGGGWRVLLPRRTDVRDSLAMVRYYVGVPFAVITRRKRVHPVLQPSTTHCSGWRTFLFPWRACWPSPRAGPFISRCNCTGWPRSLAVTMPRAYGISG